MSAHFLAVLSVIMASGLALGGTGEDQSPLHIQKCSSGKDYPTKGDESVRVDYGKHSYHVSILHPKVLKGPHFSTPFFWVSERGKKHDFVSLITVRSHIGGLSWHSANLGSYFFAEKKGNLRGFFLEDGFDNADDGSSGLIFLHDGKDAVVWRWTNGGRRKKVKGVYRIFSCDDANTPAPASLIKKLALILEHAEEEAGGWPGA